MLAPIGGYQNPMNHCFARRRKRNFGLSKLPNLAVGGNFTNRQRSTFNLSRCSKAKRVVYE